MKNKPLVYIIISNYNGLGVLRELLRSFKKVKYPNYKIIVVDNGSDKNEADITKKEFPEVISIRQDPNTGYAGGHLYGVKEALKDSDCAYLLQLCNDTVVNDLDFLDKLVSYAESREDIGIAGPKIFYYNSKTIYFNGGMIYWWLGSNRHLERTVENVNSKIQKPREVDFITGAALLIKRSVVDEIGHYDPDYFSYYEDVDLAMRAKKHGYKCYVVPDATIEHKGSSTQGVQGTQKISEFQAYYYARNALIFAKRHMHGFKKVTYIVMQYTLRLALNMVLCVNNKARLNYLRGLFNG